MCMTWRFHFPLRNYDFNTIETLDNIKHSNSLLATVARAMLLSDKLPALFLTMGAITVTIILSGQNPWISRLLYNKDIKT